MNDTDPTLDQMAFARRGPAGQILRLLRQRGPQEIKSLEVELGVSENAVREQLRHLLEAGLINTAKVRRGTGRPAHVYSLSEKAQGLFPQAHDLLLGLLLDQIAREDGPARAQQLLNAVGERLADDVTAGERNVDLRAQLQIVTASLNRRAMPIAVLEQEDVLALQEWTCPYFSLARAHPGICEMEQHMLERALDAEVTIAERMIDGHTGCRFVVKRSEEHLQARAGQHQK